MKNKFRFYFEVAGGHTHINMFAGKETAAVLGKAGTFTLTNDEFFTFRAIFGSFSLPTVEFIEMPLRASANFKEMPSGLKNSEDDRVGGE